MSLILVAKVLGLKLLSCPRKLVLIKLADNANDDGVCWPSYSHVAEHAEVSRRTAIRHIEDLILTGYLERYWRKDAEWGNKSNVFKLTLEQGDITALNAKRAEYEALKECNPNVSILADENKVEKPCKEIMSVSSYPSEKELQNIATNKTLPSVRKSPPLVSEDRALVILCPTLVSESHPEPVIELVIEPVIKTVLSKAVKLVKKSTNKKPDFIREIWLSYPSHRRGGTDVQLWKLWQSEKLTSLHAEKIKEWLSEVIKNDSQWLPDAGGQFVYGLTRFIRDRIWQTPVPAAKAAQSQVLNMDDTTWANDLEGGIL